MWRLHQPFAVSTTSGQWEALALEHFDCWHNYDMGCSAAVPDMSIVRRHNINIVGNGRKTMVLAHGYGCDQIMWRFLVPAFQQDYRLVLFDHIGAGKSDL